MPYYHLSITIVQNGVLLSEGISEEPDSLGFCYQHDQCLKRRDEGAFAEFLESWDRKRKIGFEVDGWVEIVTTSDKNLELIHDLIAEIEADKPERSFFGPSEGLWNWSHYVPSSSTDITVVIKPVDYVQKKLLKMFLKQNLWLVMSGWGDLHQKLINKFGASDTALKRFDENNRQTLKKSKSALIKTLRGIPGLPGFDQLRRSIEEVFAAAPGFSGIGKLVNPTYLKLTGRMKYIKSWAKENSHAVDCIHKSNLVENLAAFGYENFDGTVVVSLKRCIENYIIDLDEWTLLDSHLSVVQMTRGGLGELLYSYGRSRPSASSLFISIIPYRDFLADGLCFYKGHLVRGGGYFRYVGQDLESDRYKGLKYRVLENPHRNADQLRRCADLKI